MGSSGLIFQDHGLEEKQRLQISNVSESAIEFQFEQV